MAHRQATLGRRRFLQAAAGMPLASIAGPEEWWSSGSRRRPPNLTFRRVRPGDASWLSAEQGERLKRDVGGRLVKVESVLAELRAAPEDRSRSEFLEKLRNPYYIGDDPA